MVIHLLWAAVVVYTVHRAAGVIGQFAPTALAAPAPEPVIIPDDLMAFAMSHSEQWAQEDALRAVQQSYETWKDWNRVRAAMGIGRMD